MSIDNDKLETKEKEIQSPVRERAHCKVAIISSYLRLTRKTSKLMIS
ncbi:hypothetical protein DOY81_000223 [Sarcophaga bullata]|nr:hypothetical protein DOY81_000223 [Sarcophaga bullata]